MKCLVSGATGFIGRQLCRQLVTLGSTVTALSHRGGMLDSGAPTHAVDLSVTDPDSSLFQGVDIVFHLAGIAHQQAQESAYTTLNHDATIRLAREASKAGVRCFVFLSSVKAMGAPTSPQPRAEQNCVTPTDAYGLSKWQAEQALRKEFYDDPMSIVILRPALVYGVGVKGNLQQLARAVRLGLPRPPADGCRSMIAVDDLVALLCMFAQAPPPGVNTWIASGTDSYSTQDVYDLLRTASGKGRGVGWLPRWGWWLGAYMLDFIQQRQDTSTYDKLFGVECYSNALLLAQTPWRPRIRLEDVIEQIATANRPEP